MVIITKAVTAKAVSHVSEVKVRNVHSAVPVISGPSSSSSGPSSSSSGPSSSSSGPSKSSNSEYIGPVPTGLIELPAKRDRVNGRRYLYKGKVCMWLYGRACCEHGRRKSRCKECGGSGICEHGRLYLYKGNVCMWRHGKICCEHGREKYRCKECGGSGICEHGRQKSRCKECGGSGM
eukprot:GSChrysophyteH1.ASY1.ANO1.1312.1 assembled CDS